MPPPLATPVVLIFFRRPDTTARVLEVLKKVKPQRLFLIADGPKEKDRALAEATRQIVDKAIDWDCQVEKNYSDINLGCKRRIETGLSWVFEQVEEAIILEDDCVPELSFFPFCEALLEKYRFDDSVAHIAGNNCTIRSESNPQTSYYFSRYPHCWGWATWRRAWKLMDPKMAKWPELRKEHWLADFLEDTGAAHFWTNNFNEVIDGKRDSWCSAWIYSLWLNRKLCVTPNTTLVSSIDLRPKENPYWLANLPTQPIFLPLIHPQVTRDRLADYQHERRVYEIRQPSEIVLRRLRTSVGNVLRSVGLLHPSSKAR